MLNTIRKSSIKLSLVTALALAPSVAFGASGGGFIESSSESTSALIEQPNFEGQLVRINTGINLIRINTDILENMPVSVDSQWVDKVVGNFDYNAIANMPEVKNDLYYSTVGFTNRILGRPTVILSPLGARLFHQASAIYKTVPDMNVFPDISDSKTFVTFSDIELIEVEAISGNLYTNVEEATISLLPDDMQEQAKEAQKEYRQARQNLQDGEDKIGTLEKWLDDDANENSSEVATYESDLEIAEKEKEELSTAFDLQEEVYFKTLEDGALALESNYDASKLPLAKKLESLLDTVDNNALSAVSMFSSAIAGLARGMGMLDKELQAIDQASGLHPAYGDAMDERLKRMGIGSLMALPNIGIGTYYAYKQASLAGEYQQIVDKIIEAGEAEKEAKEAAAKAEQK